MSNAAVTPQMRVHGWNMQLFAGPTGLNFAGLYLHDGNDSLTYRDILEEILLCFDLPINNAVLDNDGSSTGQLALAFSNLVNPAETGADPPTLSFISDANLDPVVPSPPQTSASGGGKRTTARYHLVHHQSCSVSDSSSLKAHLQAGCAKHLARPKRRRDPRYLAPKKPSADPRITRFPLRRTVQPRKGSQSPPKLSASDSSPIRQDPYDEEGLDAMVAPPEVAIPIEAAREIITSFRHNCLIEGERSWCNTPVGPSLQACHIIPQQHYHLYPDPEGLGDPLDDPSVLYSPALVCPDTLRIRSFVPYDILLDYHGRTAQVPVNVDREALRHHYEMCCIENMGAKTPLMEQPSSATSGTASPFGTRADVFSLLSLGLHNTAGNSTEPSGSQAAPGNPSKRSRSAQDDVEYPSSGEAKTPSLTEDVSPDLSPHPTKRRRVSCGVAWNKCGWDHGAMFDGFITKENSVEFLADVNWGLKRTLLVRREE
ncbi:hypothetical protein B0T10DRAFT_584328 [Thelonectria olida]|uniref:HNH nuclease domain-containing protein n=1 Tax=Thelonectria olida TaxID=1576542 RepID=A0A9P8VTY8_9HYPO|nr:hypothetical protein B0T10DRAFT_584328 [Thelonectria olida]